MLATLAASRAALESEKAEALRLREETEARRDEYRRRLTELSLRRDELFHAMRRDLDHAFREAHAQVAGVIRDLQRGGGARAAAAARAELERIQVEAQQVEQQAGLTPEPDEEIAAIDWRTAKPGDSVRIAGGGIGVLRALPDRRGRVAVTLGSARVLLPAERVGRSEERAPRPAPPRRVAVEPEAPRSSGSCDLRGLRVDEAHDRLEAELDAACSAGAPRLLVVHGVGTGALRRAVREQLARSPYVERFESAAQGEGGDGATAVWLAGR
jgi:DNA mismatch repair protein MutS2